MIPKIIHYCWFGGKPLPPLAEKCLASWKKYCPEYKIIRWDENNFDISSVPYVDEAYKAKKYAFVTDYVRLYALYHCGGIYMDTDVEVLKPLERFLNHRAFSGFENTDMVPTGIMGSEKGGVWVAEELQYYSSRHFLLSNGQFDLTPNTKTITEHLVKSGFLLNNSYQEHRGVISMYPKDFFCPKSWVTNELHITENTHTIHHFNGSWVPAYKKFLLKILKIVQKFVGEKNINHILQALKNLFARYNTK